MNKLTASLLAVVTVSLAGLLTASAQTTSWTGLSGIDNNWDTAGNWDNGVPNAAGAVANLTLSGPTGVNYSGNDTVGTVNIGFSSGAYSVGGGNNTLNFDNSGSDAQINEVAGAQGGDTWNNTVANLDGGNLIISNNSSGTGATNTFGVSANFEFGSGMGNASISGTGNLTLDNENPNGDLITGGTLNAAINIASGIDNAGTITVIGSGTGNVVIKDQVGPDVTEIDQNSSSTETVFAGGFTGGATTTLKVITGTMALNNSFENGDFTGAAQIIVGDTAAHGAGSFLDVTQFNNGNNFTTGGGQTFSGFGTIIVSTALTTVSGTTIAPGSAGHIGTLSVVNDGNGADGNLSLGGGTNLTFILGTGTGSSSASNSSLLTVSGTLTLPALTLNLDLSDNADADSLGSLGAGVYKLVTYGALSGVGSTDITSLFDITAPLGYTYDLTDTNFSGGAGEIDLTVLSAAPEPGTWAMLFVGLGMLVGVRRLRHRAV